VEVEAPKKLLRDSLGKVLPPKVADKVVANLPADVNGRVSVARDVVLGALQPVVDEIAAQDNEYTEEAAELKEAVSRQDELAVVVARGAGALIPKKDRLKEKFEAMSEPDLADFVAMRREQVKALAEAVRSPDFLHALPDRREAGALLNGFIKHAAGVKKWDASAVANMELMLREGLQDFAGKLNTEQKQTLMKILGQKALSHQVPRAIAGGQEIARRMELAAPTARQERAAVRNAMSQVIDAFKETKAWTKLASNLPKVRGGIGWSEGADQKALIALQRRDSNYATLRDDQEPLRELMDKGLEAAGLTTLSEVEAGEVPKDWPESLRLSFQNYGMKKLELGRALREKIAEDRPRMPAMALAIRDTEATTVRWDRAVEGLKGLIQALKDMPRNSSEDSFLFQATAPWNHLSSEEKQRLETILRTSARGENEIRTDFADAQELIGKALDLAGYSPFSDVHDSYETNWTPEFFRAFSKMKTAIEPLKEKVDTTIAARLVEQRAKLGALLDAFMTMPGGPRLLAELGGRRKPAEQIQSMIPFLYRGQGEKVVEAVRANQDKATLQSLREDHEKLMPILEQALEDAGFDPLATGLTEKKNNWNPEFAKAFRDYMGVRGMIESTVELGKVKLGKERPVRELKKTQSQKLGKAQKVAEVAARNVVETPNAQGLRELRAQAKAVRAARLAWQERVVGQMQDDVPTPTRQALRAAVTGLIDEFKELREGPTGWVFGAVTPFDSLSKAEQQTLDSILSKKGANAAELKKDIEAARPLIDKGLAKSGYGTMAEVEATLEHNWDSANFLTAYNDLQNAFHAVEKHQRGAERFAQAEEPTKLTRRASIADLRRVVERESAPSRSLESTDIPESTVETKMTMLREAIKDLFNEFADIPALPNKETPWDAIRRIYGGEVYDKIEEISEEESLDPQTILAHQEEAETIIFEGLKRAGYAQSTLSAGMKKALDAFVKAKLAALR
jgi:hypothetical protein